MAQIYGVTPNGKLTVCKAKDPEHCRYHVRHVKNMEEALVAMDDVNEKTVFIKNNISQDIKNIAHDLVPSMYSVIDDLEDGKSYDISDLAERIIDHANPYSSFEKVPRNVFNHVLGESIYGYGDVDGYNNIKEVASVLREEDMKSSILYDEEDRYSGTNYRWLYLDTLEGDDKREAEKKRIDKCRDGYIDLSNPFSDGVDNFIRGQINKEFEDDHEAMSYLDDNPHRIIDAKDRLAGGVGFPDKKTFLSSCVDYVCFDDEKHGLFCGFQDKNKLTKNDFKIICAALDE